MAYTTIDKPSDYFNTVLYTGNNGSNRSITGVGFQPDLVWNKNRSSSANHNLWNGVTGVTERLTSSGTQASEDYSSEFLSFDSDGVTITQNASSLDFNNSSYNYVNWNWLGANGTASNTDGSITSSVSASTDAGFSIVSYTGTGSNATIGHGLGSVPKMLIVKDRNSTENWRIYHASLGNTKEIYLDLTNASVTSSTTWNNTTPTSSVFSVGTVHGTNKSSDTYIAYCFAEKKGYSKFGSYEGNGNADGAFIYTGFSPSFVMLKEIDQTGNWCMSDNKRPGYNPTDMVNANENGAETTDGTNTIDHLSNGFKLRTTGSSSNTNNSTYIYMAFASSPFTTSTGIPTTARWLCSYLLT